MKPNFALDFRSEQITLLHLQDGQWVQIGNVSIDDPDLDSAMGYMRATALGLSPRGIACKLILPDEAILYTTLRDLSPDAASRAAQIAAALVGRTPYDVADLVYDWTDEDDRADLAVIARETLDEAESFATQHRFPALAFVAWPPEGRFDGEAWFGQTAIADSLLPRGDFVERDAPSPTDQPAQVVAAAAHDFEMGAPPPLGVQDGLLSDDPVPEDILAEPATGAEPPVALIDAAPPITAPETDVPETDVPESDVPESDVPELASPEPQSDPLTAQNPEPDLAPEQLSEANDQGHDRAQPDLFAQDPALAPEAPMALDVPLQDEADLGPSVAGPFVAGPAAAPPPVAPATADTVSGPAPSANRAETLLAAFAARRAAAMAEPGRVEPGRVEPGRVEPGRAEPMLRADNAASRPILAARPTLATPTAPAPVSAPPVSAPPVSALPLSAPVLAAPRPANLSALNPAGLTGTKPANPAGPKNAPTKAAPNGLGTKAAPPSSMSRSVIMGFVLTILLLIALAAAAAMATYTATAWNAYQDSLTQTASQDIPSVADEVAADLPEGDVILSEPAPLVQDLVAARAPLATLTLSTSNAVQTPVPMPAALPAAPVVVAAAPMTPPVTPPVTPPIAPPVTTAVTTAVAPALITPTAQGVITPEGVFLIAGQPKLVPPLRPGSEVAGVDPALAGKTPVLRPDNAIAQIINDPALADKRPQPRPDSLTTAISTETQDGPRSALAVTISRLPVVRTRDLPTPDPSQTDLAAADPAIEQPTDPAAQNADPAALEADGEPEVVAMKSSTARTVVSQNATYKNVLNLSKVNLIGVYGGQANRYALVRQASGRFKKIYVGDRFDGGVVAAITDSELRYAKSGQMVALKMPKG